MSRASEGADSVTELDLDRAATEIERRRGEWIERGFMMGNLTWREQGQWPAELLDRSSVKNPDSVGFTLRKGLAEGHIVLFRGGWADVEWWDGSSSQVSVDAPDVPDITSFSELLDSIVSTWKLD